MNVESPYTPRVVLTYTATAKTKTAVSVSVSVRHTRSKVMVKGSVKPPSGGVRMDVTLLRKKGGRYRKVSKKHPLLSASGHYKTTFARPKKGKCEVRVAFPGRPNFTPSQVTKRVAC